MAIIIKLAWDEGADPSWGLPHYASLGAAGADLRANLLPHQRATGLTLAPMQRILLPTGLLVEIPNGYEMQIRPRSGLAFRHGVTLVNAPGTIDSDYRGPLGVILINFGTEDFHISHQDRIAQAIIAPVVIAQFSLGDDLSETVRGADGFGSTGVG
ncbi:MAG: dUTP diphosphatase [Paracoccaceae bacterium]|jgi:dUTP pyrophosphatase